MEKFNLYSEAFIFISIFAALILVPCYFVIMIGRRMMNDLGYHPTRTSFIQVKAVLKLLAVEAMAFILLIAFYSRFTT